MLRRERHHTVCDYILWLANDLLDPRQFLVSNKYAAAGKVAINGGSNGGKHTISFSYLLIVTVYGAGLLVAACANRAPEGTFGSAVAEVGVLDMLKVSLSSFS